MRDGGAAIDVENVDDTEAVDAGEDACMGKLLIVLSFGEADEGNEWVEREE